MQGQANHFLHAAPGDKLPYPIQRYVGESERLYGILDARLAERDYVAGSGPRGSYSIADISLIGWASISSFSGIDVAEKFPNVKKWLERVHARPAVQRGLRVPSGELSPVANGSLEASEQGRKRLEEGRKIVEEAKREFGYKYSSP